MSLVVSQQPSTYSSLLTHSRSYSDSTNYKSRSLKKMDNNLRLNNSILSSTSDSKLQTTSTTTSSKNSTNNSSNKKTGKMIYSATSHHINSTTISRKRSFEDDSLSFASKRSKTEPSTPRNCSGDLLSHNPNEYVKSSLQLPSCQELLSSALKTTVNPIPLTPPSVQHEFSNNSTRRRSHRQQQQQQQQTHQSQQTSQNNSGMNTPVPSDEEDNCSIASVRTEPISPFQNPVIRLMKPQVKPVVTIEDSSYFFPDTCYAYNCSKSSFASESNERGAPSIDFQNEKWRMNYITEIKQNDKPMFKKFKDFCVDQSKENISNANGLLLTNLATRTDIGSLSSASSSSASESESNGYKSSSSTSRRSKKSTKNNSKIKKMEIPNKLHRLPKLEHQKSKLQNFIETQMKINDGRVVNYPFINNYSYQNTGYMKDIELLTTCAELYSKEPTYSSTYTKAKEFMEKNKNNDIHQHHHHSLDSGFSKRKTNNSSSTGLLFESAELTAVEKKSSRSTDLQSNRATTHSIIPEQKQTSSREIKKVTKLPGFSETINSCTQRSPSLTSHLQNPLQIEHQHQQQQQQSPQLQRSPIIHNTTIPHQSQFQSVPQVQPVQQAHQHQHQHSAVPHLHTIHQSYVPSYSVSSFPTNNNSNFTSAPVHSANIITPMSSPKSSENSSLSMSYSSVNSNQAQQPQPQPHPQNGSSTPLSSPIAYSKSGRSPSTTATSPYKPSRLVIGKESLKNFGVSSSSSSSSKNTSPKSFSVSNVQTSPTSSPSNQQVAKFIQHTINGPVRSCISCHNSQSPCWRPSWSSTEGQLCNSCGLRYKKTGARCLNEKCLRIPAKGEWTLMKNKGRTTCHVFDSEGVKIGETVAYKCLHCDGEVEVAEGR